MTTRRDLVAPFAFGYYAPFWFGSGKWPNNPEIEELGGLGGVFCRIELCNKVSIGVFENGLIMFDFSRCIDTPIVVHRESMWNEVQPDQNGHLSDKNISKRLARTESRQRVNQSFYRTILLAHALLFENACRLVAGTSFSLRRFERIHDALPGFGIHKVRPRDKVNKFGTLKNSAAAIKRSFSDLELAIAKGGHVLRALELHKLSHYRTLDQRFSESLVLSWTVCENIIDSVWQKMIAEVKSSSNERMTKKRRDMLGNPSAFTASVRIETLELSGYLTIEQVNDLNEVRRRRNSWLHSLGDVDEQASLHSIKTCARLIQSILEIEICETLVSGSGGEGGGMFIDVFESRFPDVDLSNTFDG